MVEGETNCRENRGRKPNVLHMVVACESKQIILELDELGIELGIDFPQSPCPVLTWIYACPVNYIYFICEN